MIYYLSWTSNSFSIAIAQIILQEYLESLQPDLLEQDLNNTHPVPIVDLSGADAAVRIPLAAPQPRFDQQVTRIFLAGEKDIISCSLLVTECGNSEYFLLIFE